MRTAVCQAIDIEEMVKALYGDYADVANSLMYSGWMVADAPSPDWRAIAATMRLINSQGVVRVCPLRAEKINGSEIFEIHFACFDRFPNSASDGDAPEPSKEEDSTPRPGTKKRPIQRTPLEGHLSDVFQTSVCLRPMRLRVNNPLSIELSELYYEHFGTCVGRPPMEDEVVGCFDLFADFIYQAFLFIHLRGTSAALDDCIELFFAQLAHPHAEPVLEMIYRLELGKHDELPSDSWRGQGCALHS